MRHVASPDNPLSKAEHLRGAYAEVEDGHEDAKVRQFLERAVFPSRPSFGDNPAISSAFRPIRSGRRRGRSRRTRRPRSWVLYFITQARTPNVRNRAGKYAVIPRRIDARPGGAISAVAARIKELGGIDAAYEAIASKPSPNCGHQAQGGPLGKSASSRPASTSGDVVDRVFSGRLGIGRQPEGGSFDQGRKMVETGGTALPARAASPQSTSPEFAPSWRQPLPRPERSCGQAHPQTCASNSSRKRIFFSSGGRNTKRTYWTGSEHFGRKKKAARLQRMGGPLRR